MPRSADKRLFAAHRALANALARLAPVYRRRALSQVALALARGRRASAMELVQLLEPDELVEAGRMAAEERGRSALHRVLMAPLRWLGTPAGLTKRVGWRP
jgi:hypothetical protein